MELFKVFDSWKATAKGILDFAGISSQAKSSQNRSSELSRFQPSNAFDNQLPKLEQRLSPFPPTVFPESVQQSIDLTQKLQESAWSPANPYVHESKVEEFTAEIQTPLLDAETIQKGLHAWIQTQPLGIVAQTLGNFLEKQDLKNPIPEIQHGVERAVSETLSSMTSPQNLLIGEAGIFLGLTPAGPTLAVMGAGALVPPTIQSGMSGYEAFRHGDVEEGSHGLTQAALGVAGVYGGLKYGLKTNKNIHVESLAEGSILKNESIKLKFDAERKVWTSESGLEFGPDPKYGNRIRHIYSHFEENPGKRIHTVFSGIEKNELLPLIEKLWNQKGFSVPEDPGAYIIDAGKIIGTLGEKHLKIIFYKDTNKILSAYPVEVKK